MIRHGLRVVKDLKRGNEFMNSFDWDQYSEIMDYVSEGKVSQICREHQMEKFGFILENPECEKLDCIGTCPLFCKRQSNLYPELITVI